MEKIKDNKNIGKFIAIAIIFAGSLIIGGKLLNEDFSDAIIWWLSLLLITAVFYPLTAVLFRNFRDGGWIFSKTIGIAVSGWLLWYLSSMKLMKFTRTGCLIVIAICLILNIALWWFYWRKQKLTVDYGKISSAAVTELMFFIFFIIWCYLRGFKPEAYGTEKFMDYGFMTTMMRAEYMPPEDLWLSGNSINYYYLGQYLATYLTKLSGVIVGKGYNFMLMTLAALGFVMPYSIIANVSQTYIVDRFKDKWRRFRVVPVITGSLAGVAVSLSANMQFPIYKWVIPRLREFLGIDKAMTSLGYTFDAYWFPNATRYIGYFPETKDKTIHEFPIYSFVLGDLHAHVINIIFVLTVVALLYAWLLYRRKVTEIDFKKETFHPAIILIGFFIGLFHMTNYWDFPIYFVVSGAVILFSNAVKYKFKLKTLYLTAAQAAVVLLVSQLVCLPFTISFNNISAGIRLAVDHTPLYQLIILWGLPVITVIVYLFNRIIKQKKENVFRDEQGEVKGNRLYIFIEKLNMNDMFILVLGLCAIGLVLIPELIYVKDIYTGDYKRANTMFKLTYQSFIMFGMAMAYIMVKLLLFERKKKYRIFSVVMLCLLFSTSLYFFEASKAWFGDYLNPSGYKTLDASAFIENESTDDFILTKWLNENVTGMPVTLEVNGDSYTYRERVSVITGLPTLLGWKTHEWLWRSDETAAYPAELTQREEVIKTIYTSQDRAEILELIEQYDIEYIYVGKLENEAFDEATNHDMLRSLGQVVIEVPENDTKNYASYIVQVNR